MRLATILIAVCLCGCPPRTNSPEESPVTTSVTTTSIVINTGTLSCEAQRVVSVPVPVLVPAAPILAEQVP